MQRSQRKWDQGPEEHILFIFVFFAFFAVNNLNIYMAPPQG